MSLCNVGKWSSFRRRVKPSFACFFWDGIPYGTNDCYRLEMYQTNDFRLLIDVLRYPRAFHE